MKNNLFKRVALSCCFLAGVASGMAHAEDTVKVGILTCGVEGGASFIIGSSKELRCVFNDDGGRDYGERYVGDIRKFGLDIGITNKTELSWIVFAPSNRFGRGALAGEYVGAAVDASVGVGAGANVLVGGSNRTISLQPLSLQGQTGLNAAVTVAALELHPYEDHMPLK